MRKRLLNSNGFTYVETMVVVLLVSLMAAGFYAFASAFQNMQHESQTEMRLMNDARLTLEKMVWGTAENAGDERHGIWEASDIDVTNPQQINFSDPDGGDHVIWLNDQTVQLQSDGGTVRTLFDPNGTANVDDATETSTDLTFEEVLPNVIQIQLILGRRMMGRWYYASLSTQVACRNAS